MHVYKLLLIDAGAALPRAVDFEAADDGAAADLAAHYYDESQAELWCGDRLVGRYGAAPPAQD